MNKNEIEIDLINKQIITTVIYIASLILSIFLLLSDKHNLKNEKPYFFSKNDRNLSIVNRIIVLTISITFLYLNYKHIELCDVNSSELVSENLQLEASCLSVIAAILVLYATIKDSADFENPEL